jgi:hypothetical protein
MHTDGSRGLYRGMRVAAVGLLVSSLAIGACQPGTLDCKVVTCRNPNPQGDPPDGGGADMAPSSEVVGKDAGSTATPQVNAQTQVPGCTAYPTLGSMDQLFAAKCTTSGCHSVPTLMDLKAADVWQRLLDMPTKFACTGEKVIDPAAPAKSVLATRSATPPKCASGAAAPTPMPPAGSTPLTPEELACIEAFVKAAAGK